MRLSYLVRGEAAEKRLMATEHSAEINVTEGEYAAADGSVFIINIEHPGTGTLATARTLAKYRDAIKVEQDVRLLLDEPSALFRRRLFPLLDEYESSLRQALVLASCVSKDLFENKDLSTLEDLSLEALRLALFADAEFSKRVREHLKKHQNFTKADLIKYAIALDQNTVWNQLFDSGELTDIEASFDWLKHYRNDVVHLHVIRSDEYDEARRSLRNAIQCLQSYIGAIRRDLKYPTKRKGGADKAASALAKMYSSMASEAIANAMGPINSSLANMVASQMDVAALNDSLAISFRNAIKNSGSFDYAWKEMSDSIADGASRLSPLSIVSQDSNAMREFTNLKFNGDSYDRLSSLSASFDEDPLRLPKVPRENGETAG